MHWMCVFVYADVWDPRHAYYMCHFMYTSVHACVMLYKYQCVCVCKDVWASSHVCINVLRQCYCGRASEYISCVGVCTCMRMCHLHSCCKCVWLSSCLVCFSVCVRMVHNNKCFPFVCVSGYVFVYLQTMAIWKTMHVYVNRFMLHARVCVCVCYLFRDSCL